MSWDHAMELRLTHHRDRLVKMHPGTCQGRPQPSPFKSYSTSKYVQCAITYSLFKTHVAEALVIFSTAVLLCLYDNFL